MEIILEQSFLKSSKTLPAAAKKKLAKQLDLLQTNPYYPQLHPKKLAGNLAGLLSFRITRDWRVVFYFTDPQTIHVLEAMHRRDVYR